MRTVCSMGVVGAVLYGLFAGSASAQVNKTIEGTVIAPAGHTVAGAVVVACYPKDGGCDDDQSVSATLTGGASASFRLSGLKAEPYAVIAFKDVNGDDDLGDGDLIGAYGSGEVSLVKPPAKSIEIRLAVEGQASAPAAAAQAPSSGPVTPPAPANPPAIAADNADTTRGRLYGWTIDRKDNPLPGARIVVTGNGYYPNGMPRTEVLTAVSDAKGEYSLSLTGDTQAGTNCPMTYSAQLGMYMNTANCSSTSGSNFKWTAQGYVDVKYNGRNYCLPMDGTSFDPFTSEGAERGWAYPEQAHAQLNPTLWIEGLAARKEYAIKVRLVPDGPLWNGSTGKTIEFDMNTDYIDRGVAVFGWRTDIPLGRYKLTIALVEANGKQSPLKVAPVLDRAGGSPWKATYGQYADSVVVNFEQPKCSETPLMAVGVKAK